MLGDNILKLRKSKGLSQEKLGEQIGVTRQTISNWELGETTPNPEQLKLLSQELNISIDELLENDLEPVIIQKVSNTEKLAGIIINILKAIGILFIIGMVIVIMTIIIFSTSKTNIVTHENTVLKMEEEIGDEMYYIEIGEDGTFICNGTMEMKDELLEIVDFNDLEKTEQNIQKYFIKLRETQESE